MGGNSRFLFGIEKQGDLTLERKRASTFGEETVKPQQACGILVTDGRFSPRFFEGPLEVSVSRDAAGSLVFL